MRILRPNEHAAWMDVLDRAGTYDFYHLPGYHSLTDRREKGDSLLLVYEEGPHTAAIPLVVRSISDVPGLESCGWRDATSVYGYAGPVVSPDASQASGFLPRFWEAIVSTAAELKLVTVFSRMHPVLQNERWLDGLGTVVPLGKTAIIDLSMSEEEQLSHYRTSHRYEVRRGLKEGTIVYRDIQWRVYDTFIALYRDTMSRVGAGDYYCFDNEYFDALREALGDRINLFVAELNGAVHSAALFVHTRDTIQYHLSGSLESKELKFSPSKLVIDAARRWGIGTGARYLHLGGGINSCQDALFEFKAGFSSGRRDFCIWKWVVRPDVYSQLVSARQTWRLTKRQPPPLADFFPEYRA